METSSEFLKIRLKQDDHGRYVIKAQHTDIRLKQGDLDSEEICEDENSNILSNLDCSTTMYGEVREIRRRNSKTNVELKDVLSCTLSHTQNHDETMKLKTKNLRQDQELVDSVLLDSLQTLSIQGENKDKSLIPFQSETKRNHQLNELSSVIVETGSENDSESRTKRFNTTIFFVEKGLEHVTPSGHQENPFRLEIVRKELAALYEDALIKDKHASESEVPSVNWIDSSTCATITDCLRVHEYDYLRDLKNKCHQGQTFLDSDTHLCKDSWDCALQAAGAVVRAVDAVVCGDTRNSFCIVRPPGHHSGPRGAVPSVHFHKRPDMCSSGFCLLNNVCIGAAYARHTFGNSRLTRRMKNATLIEKIAIIDFDIHDGNGTAAIVKNLIPHKEKFPLPSSWPSMEYESYKPWLNEDDAKNVFFSSIHLFDAQGDFYPGSGSTEENSNINVYPEIVNIPLDNIVSASQKKASILRSQNGLSPTKLMRSLYEQGSEIFRSKVTNILIPRLTNFNPDLIFISAGFDGHYEDHYHVFSEDDYAWLTERIVQVADACCEGRIVSVLEGGYHLQRAKMATKTKHGNGMTTRTKSKTKISLNANVYDENGNGYSSENQKNPSFNEQVEGRQQSLSGALGTSCLAHVSALTRTNACSST